MFAGRLLARAADFLAAACDACQRQAFPFLPGLGLHLTPSRFIFVVYMFKIGRAIASVVSLV
jgi:hypothetical protein